MFSNCTIDRTKTTLPESLEQTALTPSPSSLGEGGGEGQSFHGAAIHAHPGNLLTRIPSEDRELHRRLRHRGIGLVELLVALSISAALLTAVAVATDASFKAYAVNEEQSNLLQRGRLGLNRLITYIRVCKEHQPINATPIANFASGTTVIDTGISMFNEAGQQIDVEYDAANERVLMTIDGGTARVLARGVIAFQVKMEPMKSPAAIRAGSDYDLLRRATVLLTLETSGNAADINETEDGQIVTLSSSIMPRRNAW